MCPCQQYTGAEFRSPIMAECNLKQWRLIEENSNTDAMKNTITKRICFISWLLVKLYTTARRGRQIQKERKINTRLSGIRASRTSFLRLSCNFYTCTRKTFKSLFAKHGLRIKFCLSFMWEHLPLLSYVYNNQSHEEVPNNTDWNYFHIALSRVSHLLITEAHYERVMCTTCKPHPTEEAFDHGLPIVYSPTGAPVITTTTSPVEPTSINITPHYNTRDFSHHSNSVHLFTGLNCLLK